MSAVEFIPPGRWKTLLYRRLSARMGLGIFWSFAHWGVGFEVWAWSGSILLGPLAISIARTRSVST